MEVHYVNNSHPYSNAGSFMEYFEGLTYEHVNFIFSGASHAQVISYEMYINMKPIWRYTEVSFNCL